VKALLSLCLLDPDALARHLEDHRVVDETIDRGRGRHRIFEDSIPLAEHEVAGNDHSASLVALGEKREQNLHLVTVLLDVADVIELCGAAHNSTHVEHLVMWRSELAPTVG